MTNITAKESPATVLKSKAKFEEYMEDCNPAIVTSTLADYGTEGRVIVKVCDLTQNIETLLNLVSLPIVQNLDKPPFITWFITSEKEKIQNLIKVMNSGNKGVKTFVFKAELNEDESEIDFECILKPDLIKKGVRNDETKAKLLQKKYWEEYAKISDRKITPAPRHYQALSIGKNGVQILQTVNTAKKYVATEILIREDKEIYDKLLEHKEEIESIFGLLEWRKNEGKKSSSIRKSINADISDEENLGEIIKAHVNMAAEFKKEFIKFI